jgi:predicted DCC family thiol-disulfide oxidoreductase YuxK/uncharacterized membrane protein YphA (DoxX/SURF4 family)
VTRFISGLDAWIHGFVPVSAEGLALSRILYASFFLLLGIPTFSWVSANPPGFFDPPPLSIAAWFAGFPDPRALRALDVSICVLFVFLLTGFKTRASSVLLTLALIIGNSFRFSFGKIDHTILPVVMPAVMAFSGWEACYSIDARNRTRAMTVHAWPLTLLALLIGFGFLSAGLPKLAAWVDFDRSTQGVRSWVVQSWAMGRRRLLLPFFMTIDNAFFWEALDLAAVAFEVSFILSIANRKAFRTFLSMAVMFHFSNMFMLNIPFTPYMPVYAVFLPWEEVTSRLPRTVTRLLDAVTSLRGMGLLLGLFLPLYVLADRVPVDTAADAFSHLGILAAVTGALDYSWTTSVIVLTMAMAAVVVLAGRPRRIARLQEGVSRGRRIVLFDGVCNLCNGLVDFLVRHDRAHRLRFASLQSEIGQRLTRTARGDGPRPNMDTVYLVEPEGWIYERSDAIQKIMIDLGGPFRLLTLLWLIPRVLRDAAYRVVSRSRYRIFGRRESCRIPTPEDQSLFI